MLTIKDPTLKRMLLEHLIEQLEQGELENLVMKGCDPELLALLRHRAALDIVHAARMDTMRMEVVFNNQEVIGSFTRVDAIKRDAELKEYLIAHGASNELLMQLFRIDKREAIRLRGLLLPGAAGFTGRPPMPPPSARPDIHNTWAKLCREHSDESLPWRIRRLHMAHPQWLIHALWSTLHEFDDDDRVSRAHSQQRTK